METLQKMRTTQPMIGTDNHNGTMHAGNKEHDLVQTWPLIKKQDPQAKSLILSFLVSCATMNLRPYRSIILQCFVFEQHTALVRGPYRALIMEASYIMQIVRWRSRFSHPLAVQNIRFEDGTISLEEFFNHDKKPMGIFG